MKMDWTHCRNPLFDFSTGISIRRTLRLDTMHCLYLGVFSFFAHAVIFAAIAENLYNVDGRKGEVEDVTCRLLFNDYKQWCLAHKIENGYQLQTLLPTMVGDDGKPFIKAKAAETGVLMRWATEFCCSGEGAKLKHGGLLSAAGVAIVAYIDKLKALPFTVPWGECQVLLDLCLRHIYLMTKTGCTLTPKFHMWVHMTCNIPLHGNPVFYSTSVDETLNFCIARMAAVSHRSTWEESIFLRCRLLPMLLDNVALARV